MKIDIQHIAKLAGLRIEEDQQPRFIRDMEEILAMAGDLPDTAELTAPEPDPMVLREDVVTADPLERDLLLQNAPEVLAGCVVVPKTVQQ